MLTRNRKKDTNGKDAVHTNPRTAETDVHNMSVANPRGTIVQETSEQETEAGMVLRSRGKGRSPSSSGRGEQDVRGTKRKVEDADYYSPQVCGSTLLY